MKWKITFRQSDGVLSALTVDATSRDAAIAKARAQGIILPQGVEALSNASIRRLNAVARHMLPWVVSLMVCGMVGVVWFVLSPTNPEPPPSPATRRLEHFGKRIQPPKQKNPSTLIPPEAPPDGLDNTPPSKGIQQERDIRKRGYNHTSNIYTNDPTFAGHISNMVFKTVADQVLAMIWSSSSGMIAPLPLAGDSKRLEMEFRKIIQKPVDFKDDDSKDVLDAKQRIHELRGEVLDLLDKGYTVHQILNEHQQLFNENQRLRAQILVERDRIYDAGDEAAAREYVRRVNEELVKMGISSIPDPRPVSERKLSKREQTSIRRLGINIPKQETP